MLNIRNLKVSIDKLPIIKGINLKVKPGEVHAVMGPNGSGKSTLALTLAGHPHYHVENGKATLNRKNIFNLTPDQRATLGLFLAFQYPPAIEGVSVQNMLKNAYESVNKTTVKSVLEFRKNLQQTAMMLDIDPSILARSLNDGFSGGEKKRVEIIQMLTLKPKIAIFDETDSGLDIDSIKLAAKGIKIAVKQNNTSAIIITHYRRILDYIKPDHIHVVIDGQIVKTGTATLVKSLEKNGYKNFRPNLD